MTVIARRIGPRVKSDRVCSADADGVYMFHGVDGTTIALALDGRDIRRGVYSDALCVLRCMR